MSSVIEVKNLTKDYGSGRGIFDVSFEIEQGECFGFLGPNGAGKTTTIRHIMGFQAPDSGKALIDGVDCWGNSAKLMNEIGYLPGEIALPEGMTARGYLEFLRKLRVSRKDRTSELVSRFELDVNTKIRSMSIGERRKLAVVIAFMHDPEVLILDEPTSGLDPIMQDAFIEFVKEEKKCGKSILLSSHFFNEVAAVCDRISVIKKGRIAAEFDAEEIGRNDESEYQGSLLSGVLKNPPSLASTFEVKDPVIELENLTKDYGEGRGIFDVSLSVSRGEVFGFVGTNGSGKTTTIRTMMGFVNPTSGSAEIESKNCSECATELKEKISYIPGEIQFPTFSSADAFFDYQSELLQIKDTTRRRDLIERLKLDSSVNPRKMSKGMKQKTSIVAALMADKEILILDEPTTGLDPIMRETFIELIKEEKARGKTIFMSSHLFEEIEEVCDRVAILHEGRIVAILTIAELEKYGGKQDENRANLEAKFEDIFRKED